MGNTIEFYNNLTLQNYIIAVKQGNVEGSFIVNKFGRNANVGTSFVPVSVGGLYPRKQPTGATTLRIKAGGDANDTATGTGAREVTIEGINATGSLTQEAITTAGASASTNTTNTFIRVFRAWVSESGSYSGASHASSITIEDSSSTEDWITIDATETEEGQSECAVYTVPKGYNAYVFDIYPTIESNKLVSLRFFKQGGVLSESAPYEAKRSQISWSGLSQSPNSVPGIFGAFETGTDIGFMAKVSTGTAHVAVDFSILLVEI